MNIVLYHPEIPYNTGNIGRTCVLTGTALHLIPPLGFALSEAQIRRAGLDYWPLVDLRVWDSWEAFTALHPCETLWFATTKTEKRYTDVAYGADDWIVLGPESSGIPEKILRTWPERCITIPMRNTGRSLNLSNAAAVILYEALRQQGFAF
jgi:tRNA (cytidine/uridine-2'-O-)-methyltransferase